MFNFEAPGSQYIHKINAQNFDDIALALFHYQYNNNEIYRRFTDAININPLDVKDVTAIPFLPISFFKTHSVTSGKHTHPHLTFESSGTTGEITSKHHVYHPSLYEVSLTEGFKSFYGNISDYAILALLPSYLERQNASLVHMAKTLMKESGHSANGFYLNEWPQLHDTIQTLETSSQPTLLLGVTFALLDFAAAHPASLKHTIVMETGGMKGRREEWTRKQVHSYLKQQWQLAHVHSEYGMTELLSQAYATKDGIFQPTSTMKVFIRDINDPLTTKPYGHGCLNIIDLANVDSCAFIATEDIGVVQPDKSFEVLGRMDHAALRGCSLMAV